MAVDITKTRRTNYDCSWAGNDLGGVDKVDLSKLMEKWEPVKIGSLGNMKLDDRFIGFEDGAEITIELREVINGDWVPLADAKILNGKDPETLIQKNFEGITERYRDRVRRLLFAAIRLKADVVGPQPIFRYVDTPYRKDEKGNLISNQQAALSAVFVKAKCMLLQPDGTTKNSDDFVDVVPFLLMASNGQ